ncbi:MAG: hypothetical protein QW390_03045 [Candidatus Bathyarchaeia archaeon]
MNRLIPLSLLLISVWLYLIVSSFLILSVLFHLPLMYSGVSLIALSTARVAAGVFMFLFWLILWRRSTAYYFVKALKRRGVSLK